MYKHALPAAGILAAAVLTISIAAQQPVSKGSQQPDKPGQQTMSMDGMMSGCREHCTATTKSIEQMTKTMNDARASNDTARMRAALEQSSKALEDMRGHMSMCMNMMNMMENMHGKGGMTGQPPHKK